MKANKEFLNQPEILCKEYEKEVLEVQGNGFLQENTTQTYLQHANNFVKWCNGDFVPGRKNHNK